MLRYVEIQRDIEDLEAQLQRKREEADRLMRTCPHTWGDAVYDPIIREAYTVPGDPPGTMGVDWRGPSYVPRQETKRWKRICSKCGTVQYTQRCTQKATDVPTF
jgi:hypothetical protein